MIDFNSRLDCLKKRTAPNWLWFECSELWPRINFVTLIYTDRELLARDQVIVEFVWLYWTTYIAIRIILCVQKANFMMHKCEYPRMPWSLLYIERNKRQPYVWYKHSFDFDNYYSEVTVSVVWLKTKIKITILISFIERIWKKGFLLFITIFVCIKLCKTNDIISYFSYRYLF